MGQAALPMILDTLAFFAKLEVMKWLVFEVLGDQIQSMQYRWNVRIETLRKRRRNETIEMKDILSYSIYSGCLWIANVGCLQERLYTSYV